MIDKIRYILILCAFNSFAQQSFFNVPSISVTKKNEVFFQEQANLLVDGSNTINFNTAYGFGNEFELGLNLVGVGLGFEKNNPVLLTNSDPKIQLPYNPLLMLTSLKAFTLNEYIKIGAGVQVGINPIQDDATVNDFATLDFVNAHFEIPKANLVFCAGGYYSNKVYMGVLDQVGGMFGFEYVILEHKLLIMGDWIISKNAASVIVPGFVYHPHHNIALSLGWQLPSPGTNNPQGLVFELTLGNFSSK